MSMLLLLLYTFNLNESGSGGIFCIKCRQYEFAARDYNIIVRSTTIGHDYS